MITTQLSSRRQVLCAVAAFFGLILAVLVGSSTLFETNADLQSQFDTKSRILDSLRDKALPQSAIDGKTAGLTPQSTATSALTETIAASELQKTIVGSLERAGGAVHSIQAAATTDSIGNGLRRLNAQINFDGSTDTLQKFLFYLRDRVALYLRRLYLHRSRANVDTWCRPRADAARHAGRFKLLEKLGRACNEPLTVLVDPPGCWHPPFRQFR